MRSLSPTVVIFCHPNSAETSLGEHVRQEYHELSQTSPVGDPQRRSVRYLLYASQIRGTALEVDTELSQTCRKELIMRPSTIVAVGWQDVYGSGIGLLAQML